MTPSTRIIAIRCLFSCGRSAPSAPLHMHCDCFYSTYNIQFSFIPFIGWTSRCLFINYFHLYSSSLHTRFFTRVQTSSLDYFSSSFYVIFFHKSQIMGLAVTRHEQFWEACGFGHVDKVKGFLSEGVNVNWISAIHNSCPIHVAAQEHATVVRLLIEAKCDVNIRDDVCFHLLLLCG